jgi:hypothetical protein
MERVEGDRPLDVEGHAQAEALRGTLPALGPSRLLSAYEARFVDSMRHPTLTSPRP